MRKKRVLLVEDEETVALSMADCLADLGPDVEVRTAASGEDALRHMERSTWDLIVTDHRMPGITGLELIETSKPRTPTTLWVLMTAYGSDDVKQAAERLDVYRYMTKPFPLADLRRVIQEALAFHDKNLPPAADPSAVLRQAQDGSSGQAPATHAQARGLGDVGGRLNDDNDAKTFRPAIKVTLGGDGSVGKTALIRRLLTGQFDTIRKMTIGVEFHLYEVKFSAPTRLIIWDVSGQDHFAFTRRAFYRGSKAMGLVYAVSERRSFDRLAAWYAEIRQLLPSVPLVLVGNKTDLPRQVTYAEGEAMAEAWHVPFFESSCVDGSGVREFFTALAQAALDHVREP